MLKVLPEAAALGSGLVGFGIVGLVFAAVTLLVGFGLILRIEAARGIANVVAGINLLGSILGLLLAILGSSIGGVSGFFNVVVSMFLVAVYGAQIWVIGETD